MTDIEHEIADLAEMRTRELKAKWRRLHRAEPPTCLSRDLMIRAIAYRIQERAHGALNKGAKRRLRTLAQELETGGNTAFNPGISLKLGAKLVREWRGQAHTVTVLEDGFDYEGQRGRSLSQIAKRITGAHWSGPRFFGLAGMTGVGRANAGSYPPSKGADGGGS